MNKPSPNDSLASWLDWLLHLHPSEIDMGLERVASVASRMQLKPATMPLILVGGTNGKGSTVALLSEIYSNAGYKVGAYTSPHIELFNERMRVNGEMLADDVIVEALVQIERERLPETLTYFEYTTLAAMLAFTRLSCDVVLLEVGLGGRLDATNLWDCDCAIITSIALDHQSYLGDTREAIAFEKVAIGRCAKPLVLGEPEPPANLLQIAEREGMDLRMIDFDHLPQSALAGEHQRRNAACALSAVDALQNLLPVAGRPIQVGLTQVHVPGRFERLIVEGQEVVLDVAHNPAAAITVREALQQYLPDHQVYAVFAALKDKDIVGVVSELAPVVTNWYCAGLSIDRATPVLELSNQVAMADEQALIDSCKDVASAWQSAMDAAQACTGTKVLILVAGSFFTLQALMDHWRQQAIETRPGTPL